MTAKLKVVEQGGVETAEVQNVLGRVEEGMVAGCFVIYMAAHGIDVWAVGGTHIHRKSFNHRKLALKQHEQHTRTPTRTELYQLWSNENSHWAVAAEWF